MTTLTSRIAISVMNSTFAPRYAALGSGVPAMRFNCPWSRANEIDIARPV